MTANIKPYHAVPPGKGSSDNNRPKQPHRFHKPQPKTNPDLGKVLDTIKKNTDGRHNTLPRRPMHGGTHSRPQNRFGNQPRHGRPMSGDSSTGSRSSSPSQEPRRPKAPARKMMPRITKSAKDIIPPVKPGVIRIVPLGGVEEIGKNMTAIEIGDDIIVIDAGMQFSDDNTPGIDYIIPNTTYLEENKSKIRALIITHGHLDHTGGIPLVLSRIGNPPVYSRNLTVLMIKKRQAEFPHLPKLNAITVEKDQSIMCGNIKVKFWGVTHTIPDSMGVIIDTPHGWIVNPGDYKLDQVDGIVSDSELKEYAIFDKAKVLLLMTDSTNIENEGFSLPEKYVHDGLENLIKKVKGRLLIAAFASHITRLMHIIRVAESLNKRIALDGRSMKTNIEVAIEAGLISPKKDTIIPIEDVEKYPPDRLIILLTGAQGEEFAALNRAANKTHKKFFLKRGDTVILSASIVPGNEKSVQKLKDGLARQDVKIVSYRTPGEDYVHATGHGNKEDIRWLHKKVNAKFFIPIHGHHFHLKLHKQLAIDMGMADDRIIVPDNGSIIEIDEKGERIYALKEKAQAGPMMVDGFTVGDEQDVVIRDRQMLAEDGMFVIVATLNSDTGKLLKSPDIISRGFVYLKESQDLLKEARFIIKKVIEKGAAGNKDANFDYIKAEVVDSVEKFLVQSTGKRPLVIPVILSV